MSGAFPTLVEVLEMHARQIEQFGGSAEIRDLGLLEAAIFRAQSGYYPDVIAEAAAMWESLAQNHPFVDGNKRTALATTLTFLGMNGVELTADKHQLIDFILSLYDTHEFNCEMLESWLRKIRSQSRAWLAVPHETPAARRRDYALRVGFSRAMRGHASYHHNHAPAGDGSWISAAQESGAGA